MALVTMAEAKRHLNITSSNSDAELEHFVAVACALVQGYADRTWDATTVTETADGGGSVFLLRQSPIVTVASVTVTVGTTTTTLSTSSYEVDEAAGIIRTQTPTEAGSGNVTVVYVVGSDVPVLAQHAALETVRHLWQTQRGSMGARNPLNGDEYVAGSSFSLPRRVMELLDPIRNVN